LVSVIVPSIHPVPGTIAGGAAVAASVGAGDGAGDGCAADCVASFGADSREHATDTKMTINAARLEQRTSGRHITDDLRVESYLAGIDSYRAD
jgi:hypothetical protein